MKKIIFFGTPEHSARCLQQLLSADDLEVSAVVTNPDRPVGRKKTLTPSAVKKLAQENNIPVLQPEKCDDNFIEALKKYEADFFIVVAYGTIMPRQVLDIPKNGAFNLHFSLLPKYRGATPIQSAILDGETVSGISIFRLEEGMDDGDIFIQEETYLQENGVFKNHLEAWDQMVEQGKKALVNLCQNFEGFSFTAQNHVEASFCSRFTKEDGEVFPQKNTAEEIMRKYRAYILWPGIFYFDEDGKRVKVLECEKSENIISDKKAGEFFTENKKCYLQTFKGVLEIIKIQKEGKKPISGIEFLSAL